MFQYVRIALTILMCFNCENFSLLNREIPFIVRAKEYHFRSPLKNKVGKSHNYRKCAKAPICRDLIGTYALLPFLRSCDLRHFCLHSFPYYLYQHLQELNKDDKKADSQFIRESVVSINLVFLVSHGSCHQRQSATRATKNTSFGK